MSSSGGSTSPCRQPRRVMSDQSCQCARVRARRCGLAVMHEGSRDCPPARPSGFAPCADFPLLHTLHMDAQLITPHAFSVNQVAKALNISRRTVYNMLASGNLRAVRVGARQRIPAAELCRLCRSQERTPTTAPGDAATVAELLASPAAAGAIAPPQRPAGLARAAATPIPAVPTRAPERPKLSELLARAREASGSG
jgi:excisionase family DNA binding protein